MNAAERTARALAPSFPASKSANTGAGVVCLAVSGTAVLVKVPSWMAGRLVELTLHTSNNAAIGADYLFGDSNVAVTINKTSTVDGTTKEITVDAATGATLDNAVPRSIVFPTADLAQYMSVVSTGAGFLYMRLL